MRGRASRFALASLLDIFLPVLVFGHDRGWVTEKMDMTSGLQFSSASFFVLFAGAMERDGTGHKKGLRGLGKKKTGRDAYRPVFFFFFGFTAASTTILLPLLPSFFSNSSLRLRAMFFPPHQTTLLRLTCVHILSKDLDELR